MNSNDISNILDTTFTNADIDINNIVNEFKLPNKENSLNLQ